MEIKKIGVVGVGMMGAGIAQSAIEAGFKVLISDVSIDISREAYNNIKQALQRKAKHVGYREILDDFDNRLEIVDSLDRYAECDFVVEAIVENMEIKKQLFTKLDQICPPETILATNTSALSVTEMAESVKRKDKFAGFHFHLPVSHQHIVDVIPTEFSSEETNQTLIELGRKLGKEVVIAQDSPGFIVNRLLFPYILDAIRVLEQGIAERDEIDVSMQLAASHPMGPLLLADYIGLDTVVSVSNTLFDGFGEPRMKAPKLLEDMVRAGHYGIKTGRGFYNYNEPVNDGDRKARLLIDISNLLD